MLWMSNAVIPCALAEESLTYDQARQRLRLQSDAIKAANYQVQGERETRQSLDSLRYPTLSIDAGVMAYSLQREMNIEPLQEAVGELISGADQLIPSTVNLDFNSVDPTAALTSSWLLYNGGQTSAARQFADASITLAEAQRTGTIEHQDKMLAIVYFGHLLAGRVLAIREEVLESVKRHLYQATRFEDKGVLSKVERLHAQVAYDEARRNLVQARSDYGIADVSLRRLLHSEQSIVLQTQLFVITQALPSLGEFIDAGIDDNSQLAQLRAKHRQAEQGKAIEQARWKPSVVAYGSYNLVQKDADFSNPLPLLEPDWIVGINISYPIFDRLNRGRLVGAAEQKVQRVQALSRELETNLTTLIEKSYLSVKRARQQFLLLQSNIELTQETLKLRERLFAEGLGTSLDVIDAQLTVARAETERVSAAYAFVVSLANLLEASGQLEKFSDYIARADVKLTAGEHQ
tara:strand:+ start:2202 stop:3587 length:1386 start_codon:yes stop_codon:yes gene_type:complete